MDTKTKQPFEVLDYDIDCSRYINEGDAISNAFAVIKGADTSLYIDKVTWNASTIKVWLGGGTDGVQYKITAYAVSIDGRAVEGDFLMNVKDI